MLQLARFRPGWWIGMMSVLCLYAAVGARADLQPFQPAPDFTLPDQNGQMHHLADYRGRTVLLAFYPKDFTLG